jgi:hypothetical protein
MMMRDYILPQNCSGRRLERWWVLPIFQNGLEKYDIDGYHNKISFKLRFSTVFMIILSYASILVAIIYSLNNTPIVDKKTASINVISLSNSTKTSPPKPHPVTLKKTDAPPTEIRPLMIVPPDMVELQQNNIAPTDSALCSPLQTVAMTLAEDVIVKDALVNVPKSDRSISDAIIIWGPDWGGVASDAQSPLMTVRMKVEHALEGLPAECLEQAVIGPRLIPILSNGNTTLLVFGSGVWNWGQLLIENEISPDTINDSGYFDFMFGRY